MINNLFVTGQDFPKSLLGPRMTTTADNFGLLMTNGKSIYSFKCQSSDSCRWRKKKNELKVSRREHVLMSVPASLVKNCWAENVSFTKVLNMICVVIVALIHVWTMNRYAN